MEAALQMQLSVLPHVNRYVTTGTTTLERNDPLFRKLGAGFLGSLTCHRGPAQGDPHRGMPTLEITKIQSICVPRLQEKYLVQLQDLAGLCEQRVTPIEGVAAQKVCSVNGLQMNEYLMYHGAPSDLIERLYKQGLDPRFAGEHFGKLFGEGTYLATNASKSDIYTKPNADGEHCVLLVRACLGEPQLTKEPMCNARKPAERPDGRGVCDSVVALTQAQGGCVEHPEYIVYQAWQTLPQFAIWYKHRSWCRCTHCVSKRFNLEVRYGDQKRTIGVTGLTTLLEVKEWAAGEFGAPLGQLKKLVFTFDTTIKSRLSLQDETKALADLHIYRGLHQYAIEIEPIA